MVSSTASVAGVRSGLQRNFQLAANLWITVERGLNNDDFQVVSLSQALVYGKRPLKESSLNQLIFTSKFEFQILKLLNVLLKT